MRRWGKFQSNRRLPTLPFRYPFCHLQSGLYDYGYRFYDVGLGRWLNRDPIKEAGGVNLYEFVGGDPVNNFDQYGLSLATFFDGFSGALGVSLITSYFMAAGLGLVECVLPELVPIITAIGGYLGAAGLYQVLQQAKAIEASNMCDDDKDRALGVIVGNLIAGIVGGAAGSRLAGTLGKCFTAGTPVLMADGSYKAIEQVKPGDEVLSRDDDHGKFVAKKVEGVTAKTAAVTRLFHFSDGTVVEATEDHPFYVEGHGWTAAGEIGVGTSIVTRAGPSVQVTQVETLHQEKGVYNLTVEDYHSFFVTQAGLWVHNEGCLGIEAPGRSGPEEYDLAPHSEQLTPKGSLDSHHIIQDKWAAENVPGYNRGNAPSILLEGPPGSGTPHQTINNLQNGRRDFRLNSGQGRWSTSIREEFQSAAADLKAGGVPESLMKRAIRNSYKYFDGLGAFN